MYKQKIDNWETDPELDGLLFFALAMNEMLYHYTIDSFKAPILNTHTLCEEMIDAYNEIKIGYLNKKTIQPIKEELLHNLERDSIAKKILGYRYDILLKKIKQKQTPEEYISDIIVLYHLLHTKYVDEIKQELIDTIQFHPNKKQKILSLTKYFVSELLNFGYSNEYLFYETQSFFFQYTKITTRNQIINFMDKISLKYKQYDIIFKGSEEYFALNEIQFLKNNEVTISRHIPHLRKGHQFEYDFLKADENYPIFIERKNINEPDPYSAKKSAEGTLLLANNLRLFHDHKLNLFTEKLTLYEESLVYNVSEENFVNKTTPTVEPICKILDCTAENLQECINDTTNIFSNLDESSVYNLAYSLNSHYCAVKSRTPENQFISLWTAIETLLPPPKEKEHLIESFIESIEPVLGREYTLKILEDLKNAIKNNISSKDFNEILSKFPDKYSDTEKIVIIISIAENKDNLKLLCSKIKGNPLLVNRIYLFSKKLKNAKSILAMIKSHNQRVKWQLRRIYRERNLLAHKGKQTRYLSQLLENTHFYYHTIIGLIQKTHQNHHYTIESLDSIFKIIQFKHEAHLSLLEKEKDKQININNFQELLMGVT